MHIHKRQGGVALLMVLLIITLLSSLLYPLWQSQRISMARITASQAQLQSWAVLISAQDWIHSALRLDAETSSTDHLLELWAQPIPPVPFDGGLIGGRLIDAQSKININRLALNEEATRQALIEQLNQLCRTLEIDCPFWPAVADWIDADDIPMTSGAESTAYLSQQRPMPANQPLLVIEEMRQILGVTPEVITRLKPFIIALPKDTGLNINTVSEAVLSSFGSWMMPDMVAQIKAKQMTQPFENTNQAQEFLRSIGTPEEAISRLQQTYPITVNTQYFILQAYTDYQSHRWFMTSIVKRDMGKLVTMGRWLTEEIE
jgi:general secretion pathway protein K